MIDLERVYAYVRRKKAETAEKDTQITALTELLGERDTRLAAIRERIESAALIPSSIKTALLELIGGTE